ncbi:MAG: hypothetical protein AAF402_09445 [Pseudomonadota bacterium]
MKYKYALLLTGILMLGGCEFPDKEKMNSQLVQSGMAAADAECYSNLLADAIDAKVYNEIALNMSLGETEKSAVNRARRKYGAEFKAPLEKARKDCTG